MSDSQYEVAGAEGVAEKQCEELLCASGKLERNVELQAQHAYPVKIVGEPEIEEGDWRAALLINSPSHILMIDMDCVVLHINYVKAEVGEEKVIGKDLRSWVCPESLDMFDEAVEKAKMGEGVVRFMVKCFSGTWWWFCIGGIRDYEGQEVMYISAVDVTQQKVQNDQVGSDFYKLTRISRLAVAGQMTAAISHEINQPLSAIANYVDTSIRELKAKYHVEEEDLEHLRQSLELVMNIGGITKSIRNLVKRKHCNVHASVINDAVRKAAKVMNTVAFPKHVNLMLRLDWRLHRVGADAIMVQQIVTNLLGNAIEAIESNESTIREVTVWTQLDKQRGIAVVGVEDSGGGIGEGTKDKLFKAFKTSKAEGLGIGLWVCRNLLQQCGGEIELTKTGPGGSVFQCYFPLERG